MPEVLENPVQPLLTIVVPTYNRAENLSLLLHVLKAECATLEGAVDVLVSDDASTDRTPEVTRTMSETWPALRLQRHAQNRGLDENFCSCIDVVRSRYVWIMGDDDCPKRGVIGRLVELLRRTSPALVYLHCEGVNSITGPDQGVPVDALAVEWLGRLDFARRVNIWLTFTSGNIIDRSAVLREFGTHSIRRFANTSLVHVGWILALLQSGTGFAFIGERCVLTTRNNSGGYPILRVFGTHFTRIIRESIGSDARLRRAMIDGSVMRYLPGMVWGERTAPLKRFSADDPWPGLRRELGRHPLFWILLVPLGKFPLWFAAPLHRAWRIANRLRRGAPRANRSSGVAPGHQTAAAGSRWSRRGSRETRSRPAAR
jgi:glycosyltransferase involved in cell wall biosynthesis